MLTSEIGLWTLITLVSPRKIWSPETLPENALMRHAMIVAGRKSHGARAAAATVWLDAERHEKSMLPLLTLIVAVPA